MKIAEIIINVPTRTVNKTFSYYIPDNLGFLSPGWRVIVSFGHRDAEGFILTVKEDREAVALKPVKATLDDFPWFDEPMLNLAQWIAKHYLCTLGEALRLFVPGKKGIRTELYYSLLSLYPDNLFSEHEELLSFIKERQPVRKDVLLKRYGSNVLTVLQKLCKSGVLSAETQGRVRLNRIYGVEYRLVNPDVVRLEDYDRKPAQRRLLEALLANGKVTKETVKHLNVSLASLQKLIDTNIITAERVIQYSDSYANLPLQAIEAKVLNSEQSHCVSKIVAAINSLEFQPFLLHGITGSGKTEIYLEAAAAARAQGRQVIALVPEIALTGQFVERFMNRFGSDVVVFHSKLALRERYDAWLRMREEQAGIVIGARSAIFAPVINSGLIIIDEEHEFTYKQEESPRYHARDVALVRAKMSGATVIMGSATPAVESFHAAMLQKYQLLELTTRADNAALPAVEAVDMRIEMAEGRRSVISQRLARLLQETVARGEQAIVLLNRRGHSTFLLCRECGHVMRCIHCAVSLVYHAEEQALRCHYCRRQEAVPDVCPICQSRYIRFFGAGTQKAEEELKKLIPHAHLLRMDQDTTTGRFAADKILQEFRGGRYDILLGTQMVAKGHDIRNVTAVGILAADSTLNLPDFRAAEKTFSLITQAAGRAGRGRKAGSVIVQTYNPEHYAIQAGLAQDYRRFFDCEAKFRHSLKYPPYTNLIRCTVASEDESRAHRDAEQLATALKKALAGSGAEILGPFPSTIAKIKDVFRMNLLIKYSTDISQHLALLPELAQSGITVDVNPYNML